MAAEDKLTDEDDTGAATEGAGRIAYLQNLLFRAVLGLALLMPYRLRVPFVGWLVSRVLAPLAGYRDRIRQNLDYVCPDLDPHERRRIVRDVPDNVGRTFIEMYSGREFVDRVRDLPLEGAGAIALEQAHRANRPVILVTAHFGNFYVPRAALIARGYRVGGLYNPMRNAYFNQHYVEAMGHLGKPIFPRGRRGYGELLRFVRSGGMAGFLIDLHVVGGERITFFGKPAATALSAAELALKYDALLVPIYGIRRANGLDFDIRIEPPIAHGDAATMTQALNDSLEALTRQHMEQWFWIHRRWKIGDFRKILKR